MSRAKYTAEQQAEAVERMKNGETAASVSTAMQVGYNTVCDWRDKAGIGKKRKRRAKAAEDDDKPSYESLEFSLRLKELENEFLLKGLRCREPAVLLRLENQYLMERAKLFGDEWVKPLFDRPDQEKQANAG